MWSVLVIYSFNTWLYDTLYIHTHHKSIFNLRVECNLKQKTRPSFGNLVVQICSNWGLAFLLEFVILTVEASHLNANAFQATLMDCHCTKIWLIWPDSQLKLFFFFGLWGRGGYMQCWKCQLSFSSVMHSILRAITLKLAVSLKSLWCFCRKI